MKWNENRAEHFGVGKARRATAGLSAGICRVVLLSAVAAGLIVGATPGALPAGAQTTLRGVDWDAAVAGLPNAQVTGEARPADSLGRSVAITLGDPVAAPDRAALPLCGQPVVTPCILPGAPALDRVLYGDLDGDRIEEAVVPLVVTAAGPGGELRNSGLLVFRAGSDGPRFVIALWNYISGPWVEDGEIVVGVPAYAADESAGRPAAIDFWWFRLSGDELAATWHRIIPCDAEVPGCG